MTLSPGSCPPDFTLERHMAGELPPDSPHAAHLGTCQRCADRLAAMRSEGAAYMQSAAADGVRRELAARRTEHSRVRRSAWWWSVAAPLAAAAVWVALVRTPPAGDLTSKGSATVELLVGHGGQVTPWTGGPLAAGDPVQLSWTSPRPGYVAVIGREDSGETTRWFPAEDRAAYLEPGTRTFGDSLRFDPPFQGTIHVFVDESPFATGPLEAAIREGRAARFPGKALELRVPRSP